MKPQGLQETVRLGEGSWARRTSGTVTCRPRGSTACVGSRCRRWARARRRDHEQSCWAETKAKRAGGGGGGGRLSSPGPAGGDAAGEGRDGSPTELAQRWGQRSHSSRMCRATVFIAVKVSGCRGGGRPMVGLAPESCPGATSQEGADFSREEGASVSHVD